VFGHSAISPFLGGIGLGLPNQRKKERKKIFGALTVWRQNKTKENPATKPWKMRGLV